MPIRSFIEHRPLTFSGTGDNAVIKTVIPVDIVVELSAVTNLVSKDIISAQCQWWSTKELKGRNASSE